MRTLVVECAQECPALLQQAFRGRSTIRGLLGAAPLPRGRRGAVLLFASQAALDRCIAADEWSSAGLSACRISQADVPTAVLDRPVFIIGAPRSGTTLLLEVLTHVPQFWTIGTEALGIYDANPSLRAPYGKPSNRLVAEDATPPVAAAIRAAFLSAVHTRYGRLLGDIPAGRRPSSIRLLEKTPRNALRIPFIDAVFPDARFIYLYRDPRENIASLIDGWKSGRFVSYRDPVQTWSFLMPPGWREHGGRRLADVAAFQWQAANTFIMDDLELIPRTRWCFLSFSDFLELPKEHVARLCRFADAAPGAALMARLERPLPPSRSTLTPPDPEKWRVHAAEIERVWPRVEPIVERALGLAQPNARAHDCQGDPARAGS